MPVMSEIERRRPTIGHKVGSTVLLFAVPLLLLTVLMMLGGGVGIGTVELSLLLALWAIGLIWIWRPRRS